MKYVHRQTEVWAVQYTGDNYDELMRFAPGHIAAIQDLSNDLVFSTAHLKLRNANGYLDINPGDYIIKGEKEGDYWVCTPDVFEKSYETDRTGE